MKATVKVKHDGRVAVELEDGSVRATYAPGALVVESEDADGDVALVSFDPAKDDHCVSVAEAVSGRPAIESEAKVDDAGRLEVSLGERPAAPAK